MATAAATEGAPGVSTAVRSTLQTWLEPDLQAMVDLARDLTGVAIVAITVLDDGQFHFLVNAGSEPFCTDEEDAMCKYSMGVPGLFEVPDTLRDERMATLPFVDGRAASLRFYASTPIYGAPGRMVGRFCLFDDAPRTLDEQQVRLMGVLADSVGKLIQLEISRRSFDLAG